MTLSIILQKHICSLQYGHTYMVLYIFFYIFSKVINQLNKVMANYSTVHSQSLNDVSSTNKLSVLE